MFFDFPGKKIQRGKSTAQAHITDSAVLFGNVISHRLVVAYSPPIDAAVEFP